MGLQLFGGVAEQSVQTVSGDLAVYVQFPIELVKGGQKGRYILHFSPHFSQLEKHKKANHYMYASFFPCSFYPPRSRDRNVSVYLKR